MRFPAISNLRWTHFTTVALITGGRQEKDRFLHKFWGTFLYDLSISLVQNISVLNKSRQVASGTKVDDENKNKCF